MIQYFSKLLIRKCSKIWYENHSCCHVWYYKIFLCDIFNTPTSIDNLNVTFFFYLGCIAGLKNLRKLARFTASYELFFTACEDFEVAVFIEFGNRLSIFCILSLWNRELRKIVIEIRVLIGYNVNYNLWLVFIDTGVENEVFSHLCLFDSSKYWSNIWGVNCYSIFFRYIYICIYLISCLLDACTCLLIEQWF